MIRAVHQQLIALKLTFPAAITRFSKSISAPEPLIQCAVSQASRFLLPLQVSFARLVSESKLAPCQLFCCFEFKWFVSEVPLQREPFQKPNKEWYICVQVSPFFARWTRYWCLIADVAFQGSVTWCEVGYSGSHPANMSVWPPGLKVKCICAFAPPIWILSLGEWWTSAKQRFQFITHANFTA